MILNEFILDHLYLQRATHRNKVTEFIFSEDKTNNPNENPYQFMLDDILAYVYYFLKHNLPVIEGMASGSTFKEVSGSTMKNVPAVIPDTETLARFNDFCAPIFIQQRILEEQNQSLAALRDSLLPKLMSGKLDVSGIQL